MQTMNTQPARDAAPQSAAGGGGGAGGAAAALPQQGLTPDQLRKMQIMSRQAMQFLTKEGTAEQIVQECQQGNPQQAVANRVTTLMQALWQAAQSAGQQVDMVTLLVTGLQIIGDITELLVESGIVPKEQAPQFIGEVSKLANPEAQRAGAGRRRRGRRWRRRHGGRRRADRARTTARSLTMGMGLGMIGAIGGLGEGSRSRPTS